MTCAKMMRSLPLAPKPLKTLHCFDTSYVVPVYLDAPLWGAGLGRGQLAAEMLALCMQLDATILTCQKQNEAGNSLAQGTISPVLSLERDERETKVTFQHRVPVRVAAVLDQMSELLSAAGLTNDIEAYLRESGLGYLFPRVELCLQEPEQDLVHVDTTVIDSYLTKLSQLHSIVTLAQQLSGDVQSCSSHKYIAHQTALLYQCVGQTASFPQTRKDIEKHFSSLKSSCSAKPGHIPRLSADLTTWLIKVCNRLQNDASSSHLLNDNVITILK